MCVCVCVCVSLATKSVFSIMYDIECPFKNCSFQGAWVAQSVKQLTLDFGPGHDLKVCRVRAPDLAIH